MPKYFILSFLLCTGGFSPKTNEIDISGHLRNRTGSFYSGLAGVVVFVKANNKILAKATTNNKGDFELIFIPQKEKAFYFYAVPVKNDTVFLKSLLNDFDRDNPEIVFFLPYKKPRAL
jgi:hypothetical protein